MKYKVVEKFVSIDGEGIRVGYPVVFIRLAGCNLNCSYCDSMYANVEPVYEEMTRGEIINYMHSTGINRLTLTGGEPLIQPGIHKLINNLIDENFEVNIETNGSVIIEGLDEQVIVTMDYKCPSSGQEDKMRLENLEFLSTNDVLKFVVGSQEDLEEAKKIISIYHPVCNIFFSPVFGKIDPKDIVQFILDNEMFEVRMQIQMHKIIWNPMMRGV